MRVRSILFGAFLVLLLFMPFQVHAQGNDFPFSPGLPAWDQPIVPSPVSPFDYNAGYAPGGEPVQLNNRKGDIITFEYRLRDCSGCYWALGPLSTSIQVSSGGETLVWLGPDTNSGQFFHGRAGNWCLICRWQVTAGEDNIWYWVTYIGSSQFQLQIRVIDIETPPPPLFSIITDPDKQTAGAVANGFSAIDGAANAAAISFGLANKSKLGVIFQVIQYGSSTLATHYTNVAKDPPDWDYCSEAQFSMDQAINDIDSARPYDDASGGWLVYSIEVINGFSIMADTAINRASTAVQNGSMDCAWQRRYEAIWAINRIGDYLWYVAWAMEVTANAYADQGDMSLIYDNLDWIRNVASWAQGVQ